MTLTMNSGKSRTDHYTGSAVEPRHKQNQNRLGSKVHRGAQFAQSRSSARWRGHENSALDGQVVAQLSHTSGIADGDSKQARHEQGRKLNADCRREQRAAQAAPE